jgi:hypothetical protein
MEGEVAAQVRPAHLPPLGVEAVVGAEPIGTDDTGEPVADQSLQVRFAAVGIRKTAVCLLKAPQSVRGSPARYQPVSSTLSADAARVCSSNSS